VAGAVVVCGLTAVVAVADPFKHHLTPPCPFRALTGLWCPFCGGTRAVWAASHGDFGLMMHANALLPAIALLLVWTWLAAIGRATGWARVPAPKGRVFNVAVVVVLVVFTVVRNLPGMGALAPPILA